MRNTTLVPAIAGSLFTSLMLLSSSLATASCLDELSKHEGSWVSSGGGKKIELKISGKKISGSREGNVFGYTSSCSGKIKSSCEAEVTCYPQGASVALNMQGIFPSLKDDFSANIQFVNASYEKAKEAARVASLAESKKESNEQLRLTQEKERIEQEKRQLEKEKARLAAEREAIQQARIASANKKKLEEEQRARKAAEQKVLVSKEKERELLEEQQKERIAAEKRKQAELEERVRLATEAAEQEKRTARMLAEEEVQQEAERKEILAAELKAREEAEIRLMQEEKERAEQSLIRKQEISALENKRVSSLKSGPLTRDIFADGRDADLIILFNETGRAQFGYRGLSGQVKFDDGRADVCTLYPIDYQVDQWEYILGELAELGVNNSVRKIENNICTDLNGSSSDLIIIQKRNLNAQNLYEQEQLAGHLNNYKYSLLKIVKDSDYQELTESREAASKRLVTDIEGENIKGYGLMIVRDKGNGIFCADKKENQEAIKLLAEEKNNTLSKKHRQSRVSISFAGIEGSFVALKRSECQFYLGSESSLKILYQALKRDRLNPVFHYDWEDIPSYLEKVKMANQQQEEAERKAQAARTKANEEGLAIARENQRNRPAEEKKNVDKESNSPIVPHEKPIMSSDSNKRDSVESPNFRSSERKDGDDKGQEKIAADRILEEKLGIEVTDLRTSWKIEPNVLGGTKLVVPYIRFKLRNIGEQPIKKLKVSALFNLVDDKEILGDGSSYVIGYGDFPLKKGYTKEVFFGSATGYTGIGALLNQPRVTADLYIETDQSKEKVFMKSIQIAQTLN